MSADPASTGGQCLQVRAAAGFGQGHGGADFAGGHLRQVALLLLLGTEGADELGDDSVTAHGAGQAHPAACQLLGDLDVAGGGHGNLAIGLGDRQAEDAKLLHLLDQLLRVCVGVFQLSGNWTDVTVDERAHGVDDRLLFFVQSAHAGSSL